MALTEMMLILYVCNGRYTRCADEYPIIIAGDFNLVFFPDMDSCNYKHVNNPDNSDQILDMLIDYYLVDVWRDLKCRRRKMTDQPDWTIS